MNKKVEIWIFRLSRLIRNSKKPPALGFMVQDLFSRPLFSYGSACWVYRCSVSVEQSHCLCGTETLSVWDRHNVCVEQTQCLCGTHTVLESLVPTRSTHTSLISLPRSCGGTSVQTDEKESIGLWSPMGPQNPMGPPRDLLWIFSCKILMCVDC